MYQYVDITIVGFVSLSKSEVHSINNFDSVFILHK
ncbi:hypothetical protein SAMN03080594_102114 [Arenibacter palladensis]|uniref:Uncharacterized protein n=1 Tax=Arenibacter palladensis TaxID=237373 RepID=A0A1M4XLN1_9FLAO|nr:hypothetical protein SAMN03080594_102114 [Arenibacter palladensis]